eukprot:scaffold4992_cov101-Isochrysis_galbana.AAC.1
MPAGAPSARGLNASGNRRRRWPARICHEERRRRGACEGARGIRAATTSSPALLRRGRVVLHPLHEGESRELEVYEGKQQQGPTAAAVEPARPR